MTVAAPGQLAAPGGLSVVIPVYNGEGWIGRCLEHLGVAIEASHFSPVEIVVVDDGSTDGTTAEVEQAQVGLPVTVVRQANAGRLAARRAGLASAHNEYALLIDSRVFLHPDALRFVGEQVGDAEHEVWTAHVVANTSESAYAGFWQAIEHVAWRRYWRSPATTSFGIEEFDWFPKGTTALFTPRQLLLDALDAFEPTIDDLAKANDDTAVLRWVAERVPINLSPEYSCTYHARDDLASFLRHAHHRGTVLIDGYLRPGTRFAVPIVVVLAASPVVAVVAARHPRTSAVLAIGGAVAAGAAASVLGARRDDSVTLAKLAIPFGVCYLAGMWRGVALRVQGRSPAGAPA